MDLEDEDKRERLEITLFSTTIFIHFCDTLFVDNILSGNSITQDW